MKEKPTKGPKDKYNTEIPLFPGIGSSSAFPMIKNGRMSKARKEGKVNRSSKGISRSSNPTKAKRNANPFG